MGVYCTMLANAVQKLWMSSALEISLGRWFQSSKVWGIKEGLYVLVLRGVIPTLCAWHSHDHVYEGREMITLRMLQQI